MTTRYFVDSDGVYIGGFDGALPPEGAIEVPEAPAHAGQVWDGSAWGPIPTDAITPEVNGDALDVRQRETSKEEAAALVKAGDFEAALTKLLELI